TLHFASTQTGSGNTWPVAGMTVSDATSPTVIPGNTTVLSATATTVVMSNNATGASVRSGDQIVFGVDITHAVQAGRFSGMGVAGHSSYLDQKLASTGEQAFRQLYLDPRRVPRRPNRNFWVDLSTRPLP